MAGTSKKKSRFLDLLQEAKTAVINPNQYGLFRVIRSLAPKQKRAALQIYSAQGQIASAKQEFDILKKYFEAVWKQPKDSSPPLLRTEPIESNNIPFTPPSPEEIIKAVESIRAHKAVPNLLPPAATLKKHNKIIGKVAHIHEPLEQTLIFIQPRHGYSASRTPKIRYTLDCTSLSLDL